MPTDNLKKSYLPISIYLLLIILAILIPAGYTTYLSVQKANAIQDGAEIETEKRARAEFTREIEHLAEELTAIGVQLASWDETRTLFYDATYYNYWKQSRIKDVAQYKGLVDAVDLYNKDGKALTSDSTLSTWVYKDAVENAGVLKKDGNVYIVCFHPVNSQSAGEQEIIGYVGMRMNISSIITTFRELEHSFISDIEWQLENAQISPLADAISQAKLTVAPLPEINALTELIREGFSDYFLYTIILLILLTLLFAFSVAQPLRKLTRYLHDIYSGDVSAIPADFHGLIKIQELENVRHAINDYKDRFQLAAASLEEKNKELLHLTYHDPLTGKYNRRAFEARMEHAIETAVVEEKHHALCYIDLDQFKVINDTCGHVAGDELLKQIASLLESEIRESDMLARLGGDEFGVLLEGCDLEKAKVVAEAMRLKVKKHRFVWQSNPFEIGISVGLVPITSDNAELSEVLKNADAACYVAKDSGRNRIQIYQPHDKDMAQRYGEMQWVSKIKHALDENRVELFAQLIQPTTSVQAAVNYEILIRLRDSNGELIPPMAFIPAAERYNLMKEIDKWVIHNTLAYLKKIDLSNNDIMISINLSGQSLGDSEILDTIKTEIQADRILSKLLCFEITETAAITSLTTAATFIQNLRQIGCQFSLDDFGSGLSSFGYLSNLEVDYIKIDGEFIKTILTDPLSHSIVSAINKIGHVMGVKTIAESVENKQIIEELANIGIDYVQGYAVHKPEPLVNLLHSQQILLKADGNIG